MRIDRGTLLLVLGACAISFSGVFVELAQGRAGVAGETSAAWRMLSGGVLLLALARLAGQPLWSGRRAFVAQCVAALCFTGDLICWHASILSVGTGLSTLLANFQVFGMTIVGVLFLRDRPGPLRLVAIPLALVGLYLIVGVDWGELGPDKRSGVALGLLTACFYTTYLLVLPRTQVRGAAPTHFANMAVISLLAGLFLSLHCAGKGLPLLPGSGPSLATGLLLVVAYGLLCQALGQVLLYKGRLLSAPSKTGLVILLQPTLAYVWDPLLFGRDLGPRQVLGAGLAVFAIWLGAFGGLARRARAT
ncbi:MAG: DMT family transporter [Planctomycetota bacterium]